jgi:hypothetical protein
LIRLVQVTTDLKELEDFSEAMMSSGNMGERDVGDFISDKMLPPLYDKEKVHIVLVVRIVTHL